MRPIQKMITRFVLLLFCVASLLVAMLSNSPLAKAAVVGLFCMVLLVWALLNT